MSGSERVEARRVAGSSGYVEGSRPASSRRSQRLLLRLSPAAAALLGAVYAANRHRIADAVERAGQRLADAIDPPESEEAEAEDSCPSE